MYLVKYKSETFEEFKEFRQEVEKQLGKSIKIFRLDRSGEYLSLEFQGYLRDNGIVTVEESNFVRHGSVHDKALQNYLSSF